MTCDACEHPRRGLYRLSCLECCLRLVRATPPHGARAATWAHLAASLDGEAWERLREAAAAEGLVRPRGP